MVLFADDTSIIVTGTNKLNFERNLIQTFKDINTWFNANRLPWILIRPSMLNFDLWIIIMLLPKLPMIRQNEQMWQSQNFYV
jgi:hypothetical protein